MLHNVVMAEASRLVRNDLEDYIDAGVEGERLLARLVGCTRATVRRRLPNVRVVVGTPCLSCGHDCEIEGAYLVMDDVWAAATSDDERELHLCIDCLDRRLQRARGHGVQERDFVVAAVNMLLFTLRRDKLRQLFKAAAVAAATSAAGE